MSDRGIKPSLPRSGQLSQFRSARLGLTTYDLQLWKVITPRSNFFSGVLELYGKPIELRIPYTLPVIPQPLPSNVVEGEHFVIADLRRLILSSARSSGGLVVEASSWVQGDGSASGSSTSLSEDSSSSQPVPSRRTISGRPEWLPLPDQVAKSAPRVITIKRRGEVEGRNAPRSKGEDFVPWVSAKQEDF